MKRWVKYNKCNPRTNSYILSIDSWQRDYWNTIRKAQAFSINDAREIGYSSRKKDTIEPMSWHTHLFKVDYSPKCKK